MLKKENNLSIKTGSIINGILIEDNEAYIINGWLNHPKNIINVFNGDSPVKFSINKKLGK